MVLNFQGGVKIDAMRFYADSEIKYIDNCSAVCIKADAETQILAEVGETVFCGSLLGISDDTPVYSSIAGVFNGVLEIEGGFYFVVMNEGEEGETILFEPETRSILDLTREDIIKSAKQFGIIDSKHQRPLWKMISEAEACTRLVVDCTDSFPHSAISERLCIEKANSLVGGAKVILHSISALKGVFAMEYSKNAAMDAVSSYATDKHLFAIAALEEKYPCDDGALMDAIYIKTLKNGKRPVDEGVLIVGAEAVIALYDAMVSGMPQTKRYISACGDAIANGGNFCVPRGITYHDLFALIQADDNGLIIENSLLSGFPAAGSLSDGTLALISAKAVEKKQTECISCGKCAAACPVRLFPAEALGAKNNRLGEICTACGACEYICPAGIPLISIIKGEESNNE